MEDWLKKWYNDQFKKIDLTPSSEVWDNITVSMKGWPKHWYQSNTYEIKTEPRPSTWSSLHSQLADINYPARRMRPSYILVISAVFFLSLIPISLSDGYIDLNGGEKFYLANLETPDLINDGSNILNNVADDSHKSSESSRKQSSMAKVTKENSRFEKSVISTNEITNEIVLSSKPNTQLENQVKPRDIQIDNNEFKTSDFELLSLEPRVINYPESNLYKNIILPKDLFEPNYSVGINFIAQSSSLMNPLRSKIRANENIEKLTPLSVGFDLSFEKYISPKNSLRVNIMANNVKSLKFREHNILKEMRLNYASLNLSYGRKWQIGGSDKLVLRTYVGVYAGYAVSKDVNYDGERVDYIEDGLKNMDFGNSIGIVLSRKISDKMRLEIGANSQLGVMNIFKGTDVLPSKYFRTSTISYGLNIGLIREF